MKTRASLSAVLDTFRAWLDLADDAELEALAALVAAEQGRRGLAQPEAPAACRGKQTGSSS